VVSRTKPEVRESIARDASSALVEYKLSPQDVQHDAELYSRSIVDRKLHNRDETVRHEISQKLASRCQGQFLRGGKSKKQLEAAIDKAPPGLDHFYNRDWERILGLQDEDRARAFFGTKGVKLLPVLPSNARYAQRRHPPTHPRQQHYLGA